VSGDSREIEYRGRTIRITGADEPVEPRKGFFSGGPWLGPHGHGGDDAEDEPQLEIRIGERTFQLHRGLTGDLHAHALPFTTFATLEEAGKALVKMLEYDEIDGGPEESEQADRG
jgi:hypothetical protein